MEYIILTGSAAESARLQGSHWIPSANLAPVSVMGARGTTLGGGGALFYTDGALDALVRSASQEGRAWEAWREARPRFGSVRPFEAWEYLHETSVEELAGRGRLNLARLANTTLMTASKATLSYLDLINYERRHCAAAVRAEAADRLIRIAPRRVIVTEEQDGGVVTIRASWEALPAADRAVPAWLVNGLDTKSMAGVE